MSMTRREERNQVRVFHHALRNSRGDPRDGSYVERRIDVVYVGDVMVKDFCRLVAKDISYAPSSIRRGGSMHGGNPEHLRIAREHPNKVVAYIDRWANHREMIGKIVKLIDLDGRVDILIDISKVPYTEEENLHR